MTGHFAALPPALVVACAPIGAMAYDVNTVGALTQPEFRLLSEDLGAALSYKPLIPAEATGVLGFDLGVSAGGTRLENPVLLSKASNRASVRTTMPLVALRADKGLPWGIDIAASYTAVPENDMRVWGGEVRWAFLPGSTTLPAVAIRGSGSKLTGIDQLDL